MLYIYNVDIGQEMRMMIVSQKRHEKNQIAIVLSDGNSNVDHERTVKEADRAHRDGIEIIVIG